MDIGGGNIYKEEFSLNLIIVNLNPVAFYSADIARNIPIENADWRFVINQDIAFQSSGNNYGVFRIRANTNVVEKQMEEYVRKWYSVIGQFGGAFTLVTAIIIILFGSPRISPL
jgi:hypothetical protein